MKLILIHGSGANGGTWRCQTEHFTDAIGVTLPGHPDGDPCGTIDEYAEWLHDHLACLDIKNAVLAGHSMGGGVAMSFALDRPDAVSGLILIGTGARLRVNPALLKTLGENLDQPPEWCVNFVRPMYGGIDPERQHDVLNGLRGIPPGTLLNDFLCCDRFDVMDRIHEIRHRCLILCGERDAMTPPRYSQYLADRIPGSRIVIIPGAGHMLYLERPEEVNREIDSFMQQFAGV